MTEQALADANLVVSKLKSRVSDNSSGATVDRVVGKESVLRTFVVNEKGTLLRYEED